MGDHQQNGTVPAAGVLIDRGGGRLVAVAVATVLALVAGVRGFLALGNPTPLTDAATVGLLLDAGAASVAAAAAWSVSRRTRGPPPASPCCWPDGCCRRGPRGRCGRSGPPSAGRRRSPDSRGGGDGRAVLVTPPGARTRRLQWLVAGAMAVAVTPVHWRTTRSRTRPAAWGAGTSPRRWPTSSRRGVAMVLAAVLTLGVLAIAAALLPRARVSRGRVAAVAAALGVLAVVASAPLRHWAEADRPSTIRAC